MTSRWETRTHTVFSTIATPSNYLQMLTSQNAGSPHLFVGGRSHYNEPILDPSIKRRLAHFIAARWTFTTNIRDRCKGFTCWLGWLPTVSWILLIAAHYEWQFPSRSAALKMSVTKVLFLHCFSIYLLFSVKNIRRKFHTASAYKLLLQLLQFPL